MEIKITAETRRLEGEMLGIDLSKYTDEELNRITKQDLIKMIQMNLDKNSLY